METLLKLPHGFLNSEELTKLDQLSTSKQYRTAYTLWIKALLCAASLDRDGLVYVDPQQPLSLTELARWVKIECGSYIEPIVQLLAECELMQQRSDGHYQICHWERYTAVNCDQNYHGLVKFDQPEAQTQARLKNDQAPLNSVTPLTLQKYTPEQRAKLAASTDRILAYLQQQSGKLFPADTANQILLARLFERKVTSKQIKQVIDWKIKDWYETDFWKFLRPQTLFGPKFEQYLLEAPPSAHVKPAAPLSKQQYLENLFNLCCGDVAQVVARAAEEDIAVTTAEVEAIGHALGH
ncbi:conserved phage C-terminal domain-containing protein [Loigolactobacillus zhaoyuanensis]|uniref:Conserved phage C-terminal domain-containing protein n=1 Tax=Loigolactobacillus zhaoyuanensis TaxID=2486017 RepID=A0ABW8UCE2_9LACO